MAIEKTTDPRTRKPVIYANGVVSAIYFNEIPADKRKDYGKDGKSWIPTHRINLVVDGAKIGLGMTDKEKLRVKDAEGEYQDVVKGAEVSIVVKEEEPYKGVAQYSAYSSDVLVVTPAPVQQESTGSANAAPAKRADPTELIAGNARNTAAILVQRFGVDFDQAITYSAQVAHNAKIEYAATDSKLTSYQVGVSVGEAVKVAAELVKDMDEMPDYITAYLENQVPHSLKIVKGLNDEKDFVTPELPEKAGEKKTKPVKPRAAPKKEEPKEAPQQVAPALADLDDDIPF